MVTATAENAYPVDPMRVAVQEVHVLSADIDVERLRHGGQFRRVATPAKQVSDRGVDSRACGDTDSAGSVNDSVADNKTLQLESLIDNLTLKSLDLHGQLKAASSRRQTAESVQSVGEDVSEAAGKALAMAALQDEVVSLRKELSDVKSEATSLQHQLDEAIRQKIRMQDERDQFEREVKEAEHKLDTLQMQLDAQRKSTREAEEVLFKRRAEESQARSSRGNAFDSPSLNTTTDNATSGAYHTPNNNYIMPYSKRPSTASVWQQPVPMENGRHAHVSPVAVGLDAFRFSRSEAEGELGRHAELRRQSPNDGLPGGGAFAQCENVIPRPAGFEAPVGHHFTDFASPGGAMGQQGCEHCRQNEWMQQQRSGAVEAHMRGHQAEGHFAQHRVADAHFVSPRSDHHMEATLSVRPAISPNHPTLRTWSPHHAEAAQQRTPTYAAPHPIMPAIPGGSWNPPPSSGYHYTHGRPRAPLGFAGDVQESQGSQVARQYDSDIRSSSRTERYHASPGFPSQHSRPMRADDHHSGSSDLNSRRPPTKSASGHQTPSSPPVTGESFLDVSSVTQRGQVDDDDDIPRRYNQLLQAAFDATEACKAEVGKLDISVSSGAEQQQSSAFPASGPSVTQEHSFHSFSQSRTSSASPLPARSPAQVAGMEPGQGYSELQSPRPSDGSQRLETPMSPHTRDAEGQGGGKPLRSAYLLRRGSQF